MSEDASPRVTVAIVNAGVHERIEHVLRVLTVRPSPQIVEILGVGDTAPFPPGLRRVAADPACPAAARNAALRAAHSEFVLLLSADTVAPPAAVEALAEVLRADPRCALAAARILYESGRLLASHRLFPRLGRELALHTGLWSRWQRLRRWLRSPGDEASETAEWVAARCALVRRAAAGQVGPWPEDYRFDFADAAWCWRARRLGWRVRIARAACAYQLAPFRMTGPCPREAVLAFEHSFAHLVEHVKAPGAAARHLAVRRCRLRLARLAAGLGSALLLGRHEGLAYKAAAAAWVLGWYRRGRPPVDLPPAAECEINWHGFS